MGWFGQLVPVPRAPLERKLMQGLYFAFLLLPGSAVVLPVLWWLERRLRRDRKVTR